MHHDDPNDVVPHEHRRELRALRFFAAWLGHTDVKEDNTLDMYVEEDGRHFLRHYLVDFGEALGSHQAEKENYADGEVCAVDLGIYYGLATEGVVEFLPEHFIPGVDDEPALPRQRIAADGSVCWPLTADADYTVERLRRSSGTRPVMQLHVVGGADAHIVGLVRVER